ncbi:MAG: immunity 53 family protein [Roseateles sp.]|uniref:immunity 53 family protein n=1 Tax=Roseateles sp. TaxID=1971397 RepID=UPI0039E8A661
MSELQRLQDWYRAQCNEDWEHSFGVKIDTLDNPGWMVKIDLVETDLEGKAFEPQSHGNSDTDTDWIVCKLESGQFVGYGGANNLAELLRTFLNWACA